jgi:glycosyltransferase involved in cell wall biosynthesis
MRIAMVSEHASPLAVLGGVDAGGQNVHVHALAAQLAELGHDVAVYTRRDDPELPDQVPIGPRCTVYLVPGGPPRPIGKDSLLPHIPHFTAELTDRLARRPPSIVHAHFWMSGLAAEAAADEIGVPLVQTFHALGSVKRRWQGTADTSPAQRIDAEREVARAANRVIASSTDEMHELMALGTPRAKIEIIPSGVDLGRFRPDGPVAPRSRRRRLLVLGRLVPRKGIRDAVRALASMPDAELLIVGGPSAAIVSDDPEAVVLRRVAEECGVASRVLLHGQASRDEVPALIRSADVVLCLPWYEPFGIVPLEAMACGVPVIGTAVGGLLDTVIDSVTGLLVPPHRPDLAADATSQLFDDDGRRRSYGAAGVVRTRSLYGWTTVARATERSYRRVLSQDRPRSAIEAGAVG